MKKKSKPPIRWDKIIAFITIITIVAFAYIIFKDMQSNKVGMDNTYMTETVVCMEFPDRMEF